MLARRTGTVLALALVAFLPRSVLDAKAPPPTRTANFGCYGIGISPEPWDWVTLFLEMQIDGVNPGNVWATVSGQQWAEAELYRDIVIGQANQEGRCHTWFSQFDGSYEAWSEPYEIVGRYPYELRNDEGVETFDYYGPGSYLRHREYVAWDNYGWPFEFVESVEEEYEINSSQNSCNIIGFITANAQTNLDGRFQDNYGNSSSGTAVSIPACSVSGYESCTTESTQYIRVLGVEFSHAVTWSCTNVQVAR